MLILALIVLVSLFAAAKVYYLTKEQVRVEIVKDQLLRHLSPPAKKSDVKDGYEFQATIICRVLGTFFDQDDKYCVTCPVIDDKLVGIPTIAKVSDGAFVSFSDMQSKEMIKKGRVIYQDYFRNNKDKFLNMGEF